MSARDLAGGAPSPRFRQDVEMERGESPRESPRGDVDSDLETDGGGGGKRRRVRVPISVEQSTVLNEFLARTAFPTTEEREQLSSQLGMTPRRVQVWFQNQRQTQKRAARDREPSASEDPALSPPYDDSPFALRPPAALTPQPTSDARHSPDDPGLATDLRTSARAGTLFPLVNPPRSHNPLPPPPHSPSSSDSHWHRGASAGWPGPALAPISTQAPPLEWNEVSQQGVFSNDGSDKMDLDTDSIRTVSSGSSLGGAGATRRPPSNVTLPPLSSVLGSGRSQYAESTTSTISDYASAHSRSPRNSISSYSSSRPSIAPTVNSRLSEPSTPSVRTGASHSTSLAPPQSIFQHPGHRTRPLSDLLTLPKFSRLLRIGSSSSAPPIPVGGGPRRANSTSILDAALASSANWPRQARPPNPGSRSVDVLDSALSQRGSVSATSAIQYRHDRRESRNTSLEERPHPGPPVHGSPPMSQHRRASLDARTEGVKEGRL